MVTAKDVKELREKTGVGMMDCKRVLEETGGDMEAAIKSLREKGLSKAAKKSDRSTQEGRIFTKTDASGGVIMELNCETDFVANNTLFHDLGVAIVAAIAANHPVDVAAVLALPCKGSLVSECISDAILQLGENITVGAFKRVQGAYVSEYTHSNGKIGVLVEFSAAIDASIGRDIAMQVAAMNPSYVSPDQVPTQEIERESDILRKQAIAEGKPPAVVDKIIQGRLLKFYAENCLLEQAFVKDPHMTVKGLLPKGVTIGTVTRLSLAG
jgi:elongation factor Ts